MESAQFSDLSALLSSQNRDGGWGYHEGPSWTEPTAYALLAQMAAGSEDGHFSRGLAWIIHSQRRDGGWAPTAGVDQSTWVTILAALLLAEQPGAADPSKAVQWILSQSGEESTLSNRIRTFLLGVHPEVDRSFVGWPWFPGNAAWTTPTALAILALEKANKLKPDPAIVKRVADGRAYLLDRRCEDGGWNHGSTRTLGYEAGSYAETTGLALLALHDTIVNKLDVSLDCAERHLQSCRSAEGVSWLRLGLMAHGRKPSGPDLPHKTVMENSLSILAACAEEGRNAFLSR